MDYNHKSHCHHSSHDHYQHHHHQYNQYNRHQYNHDHHHQYNHDNHHQYNHHHNDHTEEHLGRVKAVSLGERCGSSHSHTGTIIVAFISLTLKHLFYIICFQGALLTIPTYY